MANLQNRIEDRSKVMRAAMMYMACEAARTILLEQINNKNSKVDLTAEDIVDLAIMQNRATWTLEATHVIDDIKAHLRKRKKIQKLALEQQ